MNRLLILSGLLLSAYYTVAVAVPTFSNCKEGRDRINLSEAIVHQIEKTLFPADTVWVTDFGAKPNVAFNSQPAITSAIETCAEAGGGVVAISGGTFFSKGPISLKSNVNLCVARDSKLLFSADPDDYLPAVFTRWEGVEIYNYSPMIYSINQENVAITGEGVIDGNAAEIWSTYREKQFPAQNRLRDQGSTQLPVEERRFGRGDYLRPPFVQFIDCHRIMVEGITFTNSPFWILHPVYCSDFVIREVNFSSMNINNDGIDVDSSMNGLIEACTFNTGDDAIVFKSGRDRDGWRVGKPTRNIVVRNCSVLHALHGIAFGSEISGGIENVFIDNITMGTVKNMAIQFKANKDRGGYAKDIWIKNVEVGQVEGDLFFFTNNYHGYRGGNAPTAFYDICIENVTCQSANRVIQMQGLEESPLNRISFQNISVENADCIFGEMQNFSDIVLDNFSVSGEMIRLNKN